MQIVFQVSETHHFGSQFFFVYIVLKYLFLLERLEIFIRHGANSGDGNLLKQYECLMTLQLRVLVEMMLFKDSRVMYTG